MLRTFAVLVAAVSLLGPASAVAGAQPEPTPPAGAGCNYELSAPSVVNVSGTDMVTATLNVGACDGATTFETAACIQMQGADGPGQCTQGRGILPAQVFFQPYRPGATYTATGRGCASTGNPPQTVCNENGPLTATL
ncbi:hypothetical protein PDG61_30575 [Mycolicibacterium sp. BiH015]|uniref:hypothetical protein n=1 Tax=Mycolicibacterium sp. BiH015 TaxID=3018808 RepID=UPI0022E802DA|nr:hypothetical protein [Mycolicibacterium sp. BiH015]MDA2895290.1 hypothetical protein [Mycolicibacterium sp. BiH015]